ncbi:MAG: hypothetical protein WCC90_02365, partial [Methylocella sp.]
RLPINTGANDDDDGGDGGGDGAGDGTIDGDGGGDVCTFEFGPASALAGAAFIASAAINRATAFGIGWSSSA